MGIKASFRHVQDFFVIVPEQKRNLLRESSFHGNFACDSLCEKSRTNPLRRIALLVRLQSSLGRKGKQTLKFVDFKSGGFEFLPRFFSRFS